MNSSNLGVEDLEITKKKLIALQTELNSKNSILGDLKNQLLQLEEQENLYTQEINDLQAFDPESVTENKLKQLQNEFEQLSISFNNEIESKDKHLLKLRAELNTLKESQIKDVNTFETASDELLKENETLEETLQELNCALGEKEMLLDQLQKQNFALTEDAENLNLIFVQTTENLESIKRDLNKAYDMFHTMEEDSILMKSELHGLKSSKLNMKESIFSEVNERRLCLKDTVVEFEKKLKQRQMDIIAISSKITSLNTYSYELKSNLETKQMEIEQNYKNVVHVYRNREWALNKLLKIFKDVIVQKLLLYKNECVNDIVEYVDKLAKEKKDIETKLKNSIGTEFVAEKLLFLHLKEINSKIREFKSSNEQLEVKLLECKNSLKNLNVASETINSEHNDSELNVTETLRSALNNKENYATNICKRKKVTYAENVNDKSSSSHHVKRGGKVLQSETVFFLE